MHRVSPAKPAAQIRKEKRERRGFTQVEVAQRLGLESVRTLQSWEAARTMPTGPARPLCRSCGV